MSEEINFYRSYHTNTVNKMIHAFCIPLIVISVINMLSMISIIVVKTGGSKKGFINHWFQGGYINIDYITTIFIYLTFYWKNYNFNVFILMSVYFLFCGCLAKIWRLVDEKWEYNTYKIFIASWILQFIGHFIEGKRPALMDSFTQSLYQAPLYTLEYYYPLLFSKLGI